MCPTLSVYFSSPNDQPGHVFYLIFVLVLLYLHNWVGGTSSIINTECVQVVEEDDSEFCNSGARKCIPSYCWSISRILRNQRKHAENGNMSTQPSNIPSASSKAAVNAATVVVQQASKKINADMKKKLNKMQANVEEQLGKQQENMEKQLVKQQEETLKQQQEFQNNLMAQMTKLFAEQNQKRQPPPPPRRVTIAQSSLDVKQVTDAIDATDMDAYLNAIGNQGRWLLLQQMRGQPEINALLPRCADDLIQESVTWSTMQLSVVDNAIKTAKLSMQDADTLKLQLAHAVLSVTDIRAAHRAHLEPQVGQKRVAAPVVDREVKKPRGNYFNKIMSQLECMDPPPAPDVLSPAEMKIINARIASIKARNNHTGQQHAVDQRLTSLETLLRARPPASEFEARDGLMNTDRFQPGIAPAPPMLQQGNRNNPGAASAALNEVHKWLAGNFLVFPSFERMWKATQKNRPFNSQNVNDIRDLILWLQRQLRERESVVPSSRYRELTNSFHTVQSHLNRFSGDSPHLMVACQMFCASVVENRSFGLLAVNALAHGVASAKAAELHGSQNNKSNSYQNNSYRSRFNNQKNGYNNNAGSSNYSYNNTYNGNRSNAKNHSNSVCFYCGNTGHTQPTCNYNLQRTEVPLQNFCVVYNTLGKSCRGTLSCHKVHRCNKCRGKHTAFQCQAAQANKI